MLALGDWQIDPTTRRLARSGETVRLSPKAMQVLLALGAAAGTVRSRAQLLDEVWPSVTVGEEVLTHAIAELRKALGDSTRNSSFVETVPKAGYRLLKPLTEQPTEDPLPVKVEEPALPPADEPAGLALGHEHKQVTVLDCALTDALRLAQTAGEEFMAETLEHLHDMARDIVGRHDGTVTEWTGDGFVALFGAPLALEDHPRRAIAAAMEFVSAFEAYRVKVDDLTDATAIGIGIHTGPAVVGVRGTGPRDVFTAIGVTTGTARSIRQTALSGEILCSDVTFAIVGSEISAEPVLRNDDGQRAYQIQAFSQYRSGVPRRARPDRSRFLGRAREMVMLFGRITNLQTTGGQVVSITGEPGIGKSRLVDEFERNLADQPERLFRAHCLPHGQASPYMPIANLLRDISGIPAELGDEQVVDALLERLRAIGIDAAETRPLLLQAFGQDPAREVLDHLSMNERRRRVFDLLHNLIALEAEKSGLVLLIEDVHWIDSTSEAWLDEETRRLAALPVLLLVTHRPGYAPPWQGLSSATQISLPRLAPDESRGLVESIQGDIRLPGETVQVLVDKAQGNPFFLEELAYACAGNDAGFEGIPDTVQAVIASRIDRLPAADKRLLQIAAVVGARIPLNVLEKIDGMDAAGRWQSLNNLQQAELLYERRSIPERIFAFKHALTQDAAYAGMIAASRRDLHKATAETLIADFPGIVRERPEVLARHLTEAGREGEAVDYWVRAGHNAAARAASTEAIGHLQTALAIIHRQPAADTPAKSKLAALSQLGWILQATHGAGAPEAGKCYREAWELSRAQNMTLDGFPALWGLCLYEVSHSEFAASEQHAQSLLAIAAEQNDPKLTLQAHHAAWTATHYSGALKQSLDHCEAGLGVRLSDDRKPDHFSFGGHDPVSCGRANKAGILGLLGRIDSALQEIDETMESVAKTAHRSSIISVYSTATNLYVTLKDLSRLNEAARHLQRLGEELNFAQKASFGRFCQSWCRFWSERDEMAIEAMQYEFTIADRSWPITRGLHIMLSECLAASGRYEEAAEIVDIMRQKIINSGRDHFMMAEVQRVLGEIAFASGNSAEAEALLMDAVAICRRHGVLTLELRASCSLARVWQEEMADDAKSLVRSVYEQFDEGFDSHDLTTARTLIEAL